MTQLSLIRTRRFGPMFWTQFFGALNDNIFKNALIILVTYQSATVLGIPAKQMSAVAGGIFILPFFLFSATSGQLADKFDKTKIAKWVKVAEFGIMAVATYGFLTHWFALLLVALFLMGIHSTFFGPIKYSILPQLIPGDELVMGNALVEAATFIAILGGTLIGGVLVTWEPYGVYAVSAVILVVAILGWLSSLSIPPAPAADPLIRVQWDPIRPTSKIMRYAREVRSVHNSVLGISWFWFFGAALLALFPPYCKEFLGTSEGVVTLFLAIFSIGIGVGSMLCEKLSQGSLELGLVPIGSIGMSLFAADLYFAGAPSYHPTDAGFVKVADFIAQPAGWRILFDLLGLSITSGFYIVPLYTLIQERSRAEVRSRVVAANNIYNAIFMVTASLLVLAMMHYDLEIPTMFLVLGALNAVVAIYIYTLVPEFLLRFVAWVLARLSYRMKIVGAGNIPKEGAALLVCNHVSFVDWLIIGAVVRRPVRFVMDHNFARGWWGRFLSKQAKVILIAPFKEDPAKLKSAFDKIEAELKAGELVCVFPEGKLTTDGELNPFQSGIEKAVAKTPVPVIPMALRGMWDSIFSRQGGVVLWKRPRKVLHRVDLIIGPPIPPNEVTKEHIQKVVTALRGRRR